MGSLKVLIHPPMARITWHDMLVEVLLHPGLGEKSLEGAGNGDQWTREFHPVADWNCVFFGDLSSKHGVFKVEKGWGRNGNGESAVSRSQSK